MNREQLNQQFLEIYRHLNTEQKEAVDSIEGPVLVIAGPGTGKTQILSARIGKILLETDAMPENILCLTYTDAGRVAMRKRLKDMIGPDAYRVEIHTFHSFCNQVILENVSQFNKSSLDAVSDLERIEIIKEIIDELEEGNPLKRYRGDAYYEISRLKGLYQVMKKEAWSVSFLNERIDEYLNKLPETDGFFAKKKVVTKRRTYEKGDVRDDKIRVETQRMDLVRAAIATFSVYQQKMFDRSRFDFDDMIHWVINAFTENEDLLLDYREKYRYFLIDEYQDTSGAQNRLIELLVQNDDNPNLFVVGDDDQSIYRFQGANIENIETYANRYTEVLKRVVLKNNYRSTQPILDSARGVIENNLERLSARDQSLIKELVASHEVRLQLTHPPVIRNYENPFQEMVGVTREIHRLIHEAQVPAQRIAVIFTTNRQGMELIRFFKAKQIPYYSKNTENLFELPLSKKLISILQYIDAERQVPYSADHLLFEILHFDLFGIPSIDIAKASVAANDMKYERRETKTSLRSYLQEWLRSTRPTLFENRTYEGITEVCRLLENWIRDSYNMTVIALVEAIMHQGRFIQQALSSEDKLWELEVLRAFMDFVKNEMHRHPEQNLSDLMETIQLMHSQGLSIPLTRTFGNENGVNLLTAHGSKGLEFQYVFIINAVSTQWEKSKGFSNNFKLPDTIWTAVDNERSKQHDEEERRRLFFVAMTRAEEHLIISWPSYDASRRDMEPTRFIEEIRENYPAAFEKARLTEEDMLDYLGIYLTRDKKPVIDSGEKDFIDAQLNRFEMNMTALNNYLKCPLRFYYSNLLRVPGGRSEASEFGSAVHHALEKFFSKRKEAGGVFPEKEVLLGDFRWHMYRFRESFTEEGLKRRVEYGHRVLSELYDAQLSEWQQIENYAVEKSFSNVVVQGVPLKGKIDLMQFDGNKVCIIDYKTGDPEKSKDRVTRPSPAKPNGGEYWRQGVFYKIMVEAFKLKDYEVSKTVFQYVEPDSQNEYQQKEIIPTADDLMLVKKQITETWQKIQDHDFYTGCGEADCEWCNFTKDHKQYIELMDMEELSSAEEI